MKICRQLDGNLAFEKKASVAPFHFQKILITHLFVPA
jgi:hypothetical protein